MHILESLNPWVAFLTGITSSRNSYSKKIVQSKETWLMDFKASLSKYMNYYRKINHYATIR